MTRGLKLAHFLGLALFLGSIFTFIVVSSLTQDASLETLAFARRIIGTGTLALTLPGLWILAVSGTWMGLKRYGTGSRFFRLKLLLFILIALNAHFVIVPTAIQATDIAVRSAAAGQLLPGYHEAYLRETICGAGNVVLTLSAAVVGVWRIGARRQRELAIS